VEEKGEGNERSIDVDFELSSDSKTITVTHGEKCTVDLHLQKRSQNAAYAMSNA
jgi:hypothetical protein